MQAQAYTFVATFSVCGTLAGLLMFLIEFVIFGGGDHSGVWRCAGAGRVRIEQKEKTIHRIISCFRGGGSYPHALLSRMPKVARKLHYPSGDAHHL